MCDKTEKRIPEYFVWLHSRFSDCLKATVPGTAQEQLGLTNGDLEQDRESQHKVIQEVLEEVNDVLPNKECFLAWKSKVKSKKNAFKQEPR